MRYFVVELKDFFQKCLMEEKKNFLAWEFTHVYNGDIHYSYLRYLIPIFTYRARQIKNYKSSSANIDIILYLHYLLFPFKILSLSGVKPLA